MKPIYLSFSLILILGISLCFGQLKKAKRVQFPTSYETYFYELGAEEKWQEVDSLKEGSFIIENSFPKGNRYVGPDGKLFAYAIFWTRVINETENMIALDLHFPADSFLIYPSPDAYLSLFLPPEIMTLEKEPQQDYGATGLAEFLDAGLKKPTSLQINIDSGEEYTFYIGALSYLGGGTVRSGLTIQGQDLVYRMSIMPEVKAALFPCGQIEVIR